MSELVKIPLKQSLVKKSSELVQRGLEHLSEIESDSYWEKLWNDIAEDYCYDKSDEIFSLKKKGDVNAAFNGLIEMYERVKKLFGHEFGYYLVGESGGPYSTFVLSAELFIRDYPAYNSKLLPLVKEVKYHAIHYDILLWLYMFKDSDDEALSDIIKKIEAIDELKYLKPNINFKTINFGNTVLHCAAENGWKKTVEFLLKYGADKSIINKEGLTPYDIAMENNHTELLEMLKV